MFKSVTKLADGRELLYFDGTETVRDAADTRDLPALPPASELRYDPLLDEWVAIAAHRQTRAFLPPTSECPLCPSTPERATEIPAASYEVAVFENKSPSLSDRVAEGMEHPGVGRCEVVCFTDQHNSSFTRLDPERVRIVMEAWADRTAELSALPGVEQVFVFENRGEQVGVTLHHPHGQIYAFPFVTPVTRRHLAAAERNPGVHAEELASAVADDRVLGENEHWVAFVPYASRWPYEVRLLPRRRVPDLPALTAEERDSFGPVYLDVLRRLDGLHGQPMPYMAGWHQAPVRAGRDLAYLHLQVITILRAPGKLKYMAGTESVMGAFINDVRPEDAARLLREVEVSG
ncbi:galactose-1-phosphate uridylyltransferase [Longispora albida]|uniref:galactose-1-phosphate uridylyltransferase n=1 Tax=Longispora albida TaxID=203523 RepID=UPI00058DDB05